MRRPLLLAVTALLPAAAGLRDAAACEEAVPSLPRALVRGPADAATRLRGRVLGPDGAPVAGARVAAETGLTDVVTTAGADGGFDVALPTASPVLRWVVSAPGRATALGPWTRVAAGETTDLGDVRLAPAARIEGAVEDPQGRGVPWAWVAADLTSAYGDAAEAVARLAEARWIDCDLATGRFVVDGLPRGTYVLGGASTTHDVEAGRSVTAPATGVTLRATPFADGPRLDLDARLTPPDRRSPDERIVLVTPDGVVHEAASADDGGCMSRSLVRFAATLPCELRFPGSVEHRPVSLVLDRVPHGPVRLPLVPHDAHGGDVALAGVVEVDGRPVTWDDGSGGGSPSGYRCRVTAVRHARARKGAPDEPARLATALTRPDGTFAFEGLLGGGDFVLDAAVETAFSDSAAGPVPAGRAARARGGFVRVTMTSRTTQALRVVVPADARDAPDLRVDCVAVDGRDAWRSDVPHLDCEVDGDRVAVRGIGRRGFAAAVRVRAQGVWSRRVVVGAEGEGAPVDVAIPGGRRIAGRVTLDGSPVAGARVDVSRAPPGGADDADVAVTDADGRFAVDGFDPGATWVVSVAAGTRFGCATVRPEDGAPEIALRR